MKYLCTNVVMEMFWLPLNKPSCPAVATHLYKHQHTGEKDCTSVTICSKVLIRNTFWTSRRLSDNIHLCKYVKVVTMALLECPPPWNSMVPKASVGLSCVCLLIDHFSDRLSFLAKRSALSFWLDEMPGGKPTCWPIRRPQQHLKRGESKRECESSTLHRPSQESNWNVEKNDCEAKKL